MTRSICPQCGMGGAAGPGQAVPAGGFNCHGPACADSKTRMVSDKEAWMLTPTIGELAMLKQDPAISALRAERTKPIEELMDEPLVTWALARLSANDPSPAGQGRARLWQARTHQLEDHARRLYPTQAREEDRMKLNPRTATPEEKDRVMRTFGWCQKHGMEFGGFPYDDPLAGPDGIHLVLLVPEGTPVAACEIGLREGRQALDVVTHETCFCPHSWFQEAGLDVLGASKAEPDLDEPDRQQKRRVEGPDNDDSGPTP